MNVVFACPRCEQVGCVAVQSDDTQIVCPHCQQAIKIPAEAFRDGQLTRCLVCPSVDLFVRKDFPQRVGVGLVLAGIIGSSIAWAYTLPLMTFAILFATALADVLLYAIVPDALMCYRCAAQYRDLPAVDQHREFNLEVHERYRQQKARLAGQPHMAGQRR